MLLATQCPHCRTTFKVANDQLKLQDGLVRCGICQQVFNGIEHLAPSAAAKPGPNQEINETRLFTAPTAEVTTPKDEEVITPPSEVAILPDLYTEAAIEPEVPLDTNPFSQIEETEITEHEAPNSALPPLSDDAISEEIPLEPRLDELEFHLDAPTESTESTAIENEAASPLHSEPAPQDDLENHTDDAFDKSNLEQLSFVREANTKKRTTWMLLSGTFILILLLVGQTAYLFRNLIAATYPSSKTTLATFCQFAHCQIQLPSQLEALSYEADELHSLPRANTFEFSLLMRNRSTLTQAWPHIELTLKNSQKQVVLRRVFSPVEYISNARDIADGFPANQEQAVKLFFEVNSVKASDYVVAIFYP